MSAGAALPILKRVFCLFIALATSIAAHADSPAQPVPDDDKCAIPVDSSWTKQEQFVWRNVCVGKDANFNYEPGYGGDLNPKSPAGLPKNRILRASFLETILLKDKYRNALTRLGVRIIGARFTERFANKLQHELWLVRSLFEHDVNFALVETSRPITFDQSIILGAFIATEIQIDQNLFMRDARFTDVDLMVAHIGNTLDLSGSTVTGKFNMSTIRVDGNMFMRGTHFNEIALIGAHIGNTLELDGSTVTGKLIMSTIRVDGNLFMRGTQFNEIALIGAHIGNTLELDRSKVTGKLDMNAIRVDQGLFMRGTQFDDIILIGAVMGRNLDLSSSTVTGKLNMNGIRVSESLIMHDKAHFNMVDLTVAQIGLNLHLRSSTVTGMLDMRGIRVNLNLLMQDKAQFNEIDLASAHIGGQLDLRSSAVTGELEGKSVDIEQTMFLGDGAKFTHEIDLKSAKLGQDLDLSDGTFNEVVDLTGAQVSGALGLESTRWLGTATLNLTDAAVGEINLSDNWPDKVELNGLTYRNLSKLEHFSREQAELRFGKVQPYAPQPYQQLANVLQANGRITDATAIRYASKEQEQKTTPVGLYKAWLVLLNYSIGFGYHLEFAFYWAIGFVLLGWLVLYSTGQRTKYGITLGLAYSFDMLLPLVHLRRKHYDIDLDPWPRRYFFAHKIIGVILGSFIVAGISGLTK